jgi:DMSO/TMAO reductase YedYZ molybdopterin-dependent catalytic subunit
MTATEPETPLRPPRRVGSGIFLGALLGGLSSLYWGESVWSRISSAISPLEAEIPLIPSGTWRIYTISGSLPAFDPKTWRLAVGGAVANPISLSYHDLRTLPKVEQVSTFHCVTGWTVKNVHWGGVRMDHVLGLVNPSPAAHALEFASFGQPYTDYLTLQQAALHDVMLAYEMDGQPLPREHGAPLRLIIPEMYGYKNVKWLGAINFVPKLEPGYWEQAGYDVDAWVGHSNGYGL